MNDRRPAYWADDTENLGVSIRQGDIPCTAVLGGPGAVVPEFPLVALSTLSSLLVVGGVLAARRRQVVGRPI